MWLLALLLSAAPPHVLDGAGPVAAAPAGWIPGAALAATVATILLFAAINEVKMARRRHRRG